MEHGYSLPRHVEIARSPEQHRIARDHLIEELKQDVVGYPMRRLTADTPGYAKVKA